MLGWAVDYDVLKKNPASETFYFILGNISKPNILIQHCNKWEIGTSLFLFSSSKTRYPSFLGSKITQIRQKITSDLPYPFLILLNYNSREIEKKIRNQSQRTAKATYLLPYLLQTIPQKFFGFGNSFSQKSLPPETRGLTWSLLWTITFSLVNYPFASYV